MTSILVGILLVVLGAALMGWHWAAWRRRSDEQCSGDQRQFQWRQFLRRMRAGGLIVVLGAFFLLDGLVVNPYARIFYWSAAACIVAWLVILALADVIRTREQFHRLRSDYLTQSAALQEEIARFKRENSNGHADSGKNAPARGTEK